MDLILLEKVQNLGNLGDQVTVKSGYGRNFLVPHGKAVPATKDNVAHFETRRSGLEAAEKGKLGEAETRAASLTGLVVEMKANASDEGSLYGSIGPREIAMAVSDLGHELEKSEVIMGEGPIRAVGDYDVVVHLHADVEFEIKVNVRAE